MASFNALESDEVSKVDGSEGFGQSETYDVHESKDLGDDLLDDLDSYWEDINDRLTISRMVSDSIIKGMVNAVSQDAAEKLAAKDLEVVRMKDRLCCSENHSCIAIRKHWQEHDRESLALLNQAVNQQLVKLQICIASAKDPKFKENIEELSGDFAESLIRNYDLDEAFYSFKATLKDMCHQVDLIAQTNNDFVQEWKVELDICKQVEAMVFCTVVQGLQYEFEKQLWDVNKVLALIDKFNEIPSLRHELNSIHKGLVGLEKESLSPQVSIELDHYHRKFSSNHGLPSTQDGNGGCEESKFSMPEKLPCELNHLKTHELYQYFRTVLTEMKREHESTVHKMTEENFTLRRELLKESKPVKEKGPFAALKKDRDFEVIKNNISDVIAKLDVIVRENEKLSEFCNHSKEKLDSLLSENHHLKALLSGQKLELRHLSLQASDAAEKLLQRSWAEENMHKLVGDLKDALQDEQIEASISEEVFKCMLREMAALSNSSCDDLDLKSIIMQDIVRIIYDEAFHTHDVASKLNYEETLDLQSFIIQQVYGIVFQEVLKDTSMELNELKDRCVKEDEGLIFLQRKVLDIEKELTIKVEENENLRHNMLEFESAIAEKDKLLLERTVVNETEKAKFAEELNNLRCLKIRLEALLSERNEEMVLLEGKLEDCQKQHEFYKSEVVKLKKAIQLSEDELRKSKHEKANIRFVLEQKQSYLASMKVKESEHDKLMESLSLVIHDLLNSFADFELKIKESVGWHNVRLENSAFQLHYLIPKVNVFRRTNHLYKERLEKNSSDLQKAEAEVDLLGDEVDALLSLLEKIYVALDHYSPILQHYPGIIEILKLVKRELSGEAVKAV